MQRCNDSDDYLWHLLEEASKNETMMRTDIKRFYKKDSIEDKDTGGAVHGMYSPIKD